MKILKHMVAWTAKGNEGGGNHSFGDENEMDEFIKSNKHKWASHGRYTLHESGTPGILEAKHANKKENLSRITESTLPSVIRLAREKNIAFESAAAQLGYTL